MLPFAAPVQLRQELEKLNRWITTLSTLKVKEESPKKSSLKLARYTVDNEDISKAILRDDRDELERLLKDGDRVSVHILF